MSLARKHQATVLASLSAAATPIEAGGPALPVAVPNNPGATAAAQMAARLRHDRQRLKQIQSVEKKIEAKREMIPEYDAWIEGVLASGQATGRGSADPILPTMMVWKIDTGDFVGAVRLAEHVLLHKLPLPDHFQRQAPTLIVEEIAEQALRMLAAGKSFPVDLLEDIELLTEGEDMPDEVRAKLFKAIGLEYDRRADDADGAGGPQALAALRRAQQLHDRVGVKDKIKRLERAAVKGSTAAETQTAPAEPASTSSPPGARGRIARSGRAGRLRAATDPIPTPVTAGEKAGPADE